MHKPKGVLTTMEDPLGRPTIADYLEKLPVRLFPVGRLDWDSEGLLLLTNDGEFAQKVAHPTSEVTKTYIVKVDGSPKNEDLARLKHGVSIPGGRVKALAVSRFPKGDSKKYSWVKIVITEGKNRQIRYMFEKIGFDVIKLQRVAIGRLRLGALERGQISFLNEIAAERVFHKFLDENGQAPSEQDDRPFAGGAPEREGRAARPGMREAHARAVSVREAHARARGEDPKTLRHGNEPKVRSGRGAINKHAPRRKYEGGVKVTKARDVKHASDKRSVKARPKSKKRDQPTGSFDFDAFD